MSEAHLERYTNHDEQVTAEELQFLKEHEPYLDFRIVSAEEVDLSRGRQSRVSVLEYDHGGETYSVLWKRMAYEKGLTEEEALKFESRINPYRQSLIHSRWNIPKVFFTKVCDMPDENQIFSYEQFIMGGDGEKLLADETQPNFKKWFLIKEIARTLYNYPASDLERTNIDGVKLSRLSHGLDLKLANVVLEEKTNDLYFVDLFGPKELDGLGKWLTYSSKLDTLSEDKLLAVCATREGALLRCWRLAENTWVNGYQSPEKLRAEFLIHLVEVGIANQEYQFIKNEIENGYPWLDSIYQEKQI